MRDQWYGDNRDIVKWSALVHLARRDGVSAILHVAMYRPDRPPEPLAGVRGEVPPAVEVIRHFRDLDDIQRLASATGFRIEVLKDLFTDRAAYFTRVCELIQARDDRPVLVFLDPDVGLATESPGPEHVSSAEVAAVYEALRPDDMLVCYQHARRQKDWRGRARRAFANAPGLPSFQVEVLQCDLARDVLLFAVKKDPAPSAGQPESE